MKLQKMGLFATPDSSEQLTTYLDKFTGSERTAAMVAMGMTWNLAASIVDQEQFFDPTFADEIVFNALDNAPTEFVRALAKAYLLGNAIQKRQIFNSFGEIWQDQGRHFLNLGESVRYDS